MTTAEFYLKDVWTKTLNNIFNSGKIDEESFNMVFMPSKLRSLSENGALIVVQNMVDFTIMNQNKELIENCFEDAYGQRYPMTFITQENLKEYLNTNETFTNDFIINTIDPSFTFESFVVGKSNAQAHLASLTCANNLGVLYNPLFIYGNSGLGKTHLLNAIGNYVYYNNKNKKIGFISGLDFMDGVSQASKENRFDEFKQSFSDLDLLLVDDIQFIGGPGKVKTHEVFFSIFKDLINNKKQICITSDRAPGEIEGLEDRIISRFNQGLNVNIEAPEYETSMEILKSKINSNINSNQSVDEEVLSYIATNFSQDVRSLEGAVNRLLFYSIFCNKEHINIDLAIEAFKGQIQSSNNELNMALIRRTVCDYYNLTKQQIISKTRTKNIANARHIAMYLCRKLLDAPYKDIGNEFGKRDHTTVMSACERIEKLIKTDPLFLKAINDIETRLK